jgi:hypothetical protein
MCVGNVFWKRMHVGTHHIFLIGAWPFNYLFGRYGSSSLKLEALKDNSSRVKRGSNMCKLKSLISEKKLLAVVFLLLVTLMFAVQAQDQQKPLSDEEKQLADLVNMYRVDNGLPAVPITNSLTKVARTHIIDLNTYHPMHAGVCDWHSWSNHGDWTEVCCTYTDATYLQTNSKPREITESYDSDGYEIAFHKQGSEATPEDAFDYFKNFGSIHVLGVDDNDLILERNDWSDYNWRAMGVGIDGNYAVFWFGEIEDPAGPVPTTLPGNYHIERPGEPWDRDTAIRPGTATSEDYPDIEGPDCTESYCTDVNLLHRCDHGSERLEPQGCFLGIFGPPNEQFRVGDGPNAFADVYYAEFNVDIVGGTGQADPAQDAPRLVILVDKILDGGVNLAQDSQFKINDKPARKLKDYGSKTTDEGKDKFLYKLEVSDLQTGKNTLKITPKGDDFAIYKIWIENAKGERIWQMRNDPCSYQSECKFDDRYNPYQLACDFTATTHVCKERKGTGKPCEKNFECVSETCSGNACT